MYNGKTKKVLKFLIFHKKACKNCMKAEINGNVTFCFLFSCRNNTTLWKIFLWTCVLISGFNVKCFKFKQLSFYSTCHGFFSVIRNSTSIELDSSHDVKLISSPGYPGYYPRYTEMRFVVVAPEGYNVKLDVLDLYIPSGCYNDYIYIYDGTFAT